MPFVKLDCGILNSTLWVEPIERDIFITALLMAVPFEFKTPQPQIAVNEIKETGFIVQPGWYGLVEAAGPGIVRRAFIEQEPGMRALAKLGEPDPGSRSQAWDGRRLIRIDGGYLVLNYMNYLLKDYGAAERMRRLRARKRSAVRVTDGGVTRTVTYAYAYANADTEKKNTAHSAKPHALPTGFPDFWKAYPLKKAKGQAIKAWNKLKPSDEQVAMIVSAIATQTRERQSLHHAGEFVPEWKYPATWLNGECWLDEARQPVAQAGARRAMFEGAL